jgi:S-adenosylmethionine hydrolase
MIVLFTDFGHEGPYMGEMRAAVLRIAPGQPVVDLMTDVPSFDIRAGAYLLPGLSESFDAGTVFVGVVDPGVGGSRRPIVVRAADKWFVGPDNGLFAPVLKRFGGAAWEIAWRPDRLSASFHGRDLFAPVAARIATTGEVSGNTVAADHLVGMDWPEDWPQIIYIDRYGNAMTGLQGSDADPDATLCVGEYHLAHAETFAMAPAGEAFWYVNSSGLVEIAVNQGHAARTLSLDLGTEVALTRLQP